MLIAIGGNALIHDGQRGTIAEQFDNSRAIARQVAALVVAGWRVVVTHGNGPQVGFILLRSELAPDDATIPRLSLDMAVADSQGGLGYIIGNTLVSELGRLGLRDRVACLLTQTVVDADDPAFAAPSKPIGAFFSADEARVHRTRDGWMMVEDAGRGYRRVVASPRPRRIVETAAIQALLAAGFVVIAAGGGGIPIVEAAPGIYRGVEAVVDKDLASAQLGAALGASVLLLSTGVEKVATGFGTPARRDLDRVAVAEMRRHLAAGEFPAGSMGPKIEAAIAFLEHGGREVIVTSAHHLGDAVAGRTGTHITAG
jgi:carbamate kinase